MLFFIRALLFVLIFNLASISMTLVAKDNDSVRNKVIELASSYMDKGLKYREKVAVVHPNSSEVREFNFDCSGFVSAIYWQLDIGVFEKELSKTQMSTATIHSILKKSNKIYKAKPIKGDVVFFNRTTSRETPLSHIGIVIDTDKNGITSFIHMSNSGVKIGYINLAKPNEYRSGNVVFNSYVRSGVGTRGLTSKCFDSYGAIYNKP